MLHIEQKFTFIISVVIFRYNNAEIGSDIFSINYLLCVSDYPQPKTELIFAYPCNYLDITLSPHTFIWPNKIYLERNSVFEFLFLKRRFVQFRQQLGMLTKFIVFIVICIIFITHFDYNRNCFIVLSIFNCYFIEFIVIQCCCFVRLF